MRIVTLKELVRRAAASSQAAEDASQKLVAALFDLATKELEQGNRVELDKVLAPLALRRAAAAAAGGKRGEVPERAEPYKIALVVPRKDFFATLVCNRLTGPRSQAVIYEGIESYLGVLSAHRGDLVVVDATLPGAREMTRALKRSKETNMTGVIAVYPEGTDPNKLDGLRLCEDESLVEPFELGEMVEAAESEIRRSHEERTFFQQQVHFQLPTRDEAIEEANALVAELVEQTGMNKDRGYALAAAFHEAVDNAARHGNKSQASRMIDVVYLLDKQKITVTVQDEGDGFDTEMYLRRGTHGNAVAVARERNEAGRTGGLGIMLMLKCLDNLEYNYAGNQVKLTKFVNK